MSELSVRTKFIGRCFDWLEVKKAINQEHGLWYNHVYETPHYEVIKTYGQSEYQIYRKPEKEAQDEND